MYAPFHACLLTNGTEFLPCPLLQPQPGAGEQEQEEQLVWHIDVCIQGQSHAKTQPSRRRLTHREHRVRALFLRLLAGACTDDVRTRVSTSCSDALSTHSSLSQNLGRLSEESGSSSCAPGLLRYPVHTPDSPQSQTALIYRHRLCGAVQGADGPIGWKIQHIRLSTRRRRGALCSRRWFLSHRAPRHCHLSHRAPRHCHRHLQVRLPM